MDYNLFAKVEYNSQEEEENGIETIYPHLYDDLTKNTANVMERLKKEKEEVEAILKKR